MTSPAPTGPASAPTRLLLAFFSLTYISTWSLYFVAGAIPLDGGAGRAGFAVLRGALLLLGTITPSLVALALTARAEGRVGVRALLDRIFQGPASLRWYAFALLYVATIKLAAAVLLRLFTGAWPRFGHEAIYVMAGAIVISTPVQAGEEVGWRGYALPRLAQRFGLARASIVLGVIWALWHLPGFLVAGVDNAGQSFPVFVLGVTALSVAMAWLYWRTRGSLLLTMLLHAAANNTKDIVPSTVPGATHPFALSTSPVAWLSVALMWICAVYFLVRMRGARL